MMFPIHRIASVVSYRCWVTLDEMRGTSRMPLTVYARRLYACAAQDEGHSYPDIARGLGRERHSSAFGWCNHPMTQTDEFKDDLEGVKDAIEQLRDEDIQELKEACQ